MTTAIADQIRQLRELPDGWFDGQGTAYPESGLAWLEKTLCGVYAHWFPAPPLIYPMPGDGCVQLAWRHGPFDHTAEINLFARVCHWHCLDHSTDEAYDFDLNLERPGDWSWLAERVHPLNQGNPLDPLWMSGANMDPPSETYLSFRKLMTPA